MTQDHPELPKEIGQALGRLGWVAPPDPSVLDAAREVLWAAVAAEVLPEAAGEVGQISIAAGGAGSLPGALLAPRLARTFGTARALVLTSLGYGLAGLLIPLTGRGHRMACYVIGSALIAGGLAVGNVIIGSFRQQYCPPSLLGRVTASMRFLGYGMIPLGALLAGALLAGALGMALGVRDALWIVQGIFAASALLLLTPRIRTARDLPGYDLTSSLA